MRPLDPRLVRTARAVRVHLAVTVACGVAVTALILLQAWLLARAIAGATSGAGPEQLAWTIAALAGVAVARALLSYGAETAALRSAARAKSQLRTRLVAHVTGADRAGGEPQTAWLAGESGTGTPRAGELVTLATRGLDALDDYFARYLPQLVLATLVPVAVLVVVFSADWISGVIIAVTIPLIPLFMALVGMHTQQRTQRQWALLNRLGGHFLDVVEGLPTLAVFRRAKAQAAIIRQITEEHRTTTMATLRVAFLSAFVLELLATLAVALVAVQIGIRLMYGLLDFETALLVLILAPEAYLPLREVGARFHASMEGVAAAQQVFATLDEKAAVNDAPRTAERSGPLRGPGGAAPRIRLDGVTLVYPGREAPALREVSVAFEPGRRTLLTGPSGSGKSSLLALLLRMREPTAGAVRITPGSAAEAPLSEVPADAWRELIAWVPQHPYLFDDTVSGNIRLGAPDADDAAVRRAAERAEAHTFVTRLPDGYATRLGERGARLSAGQRQRIALARAFLRDAPIVLLDEPTAHLDPDNATAVRIAVGRLLEGRTGIIVAHDLGWASVADDVIPIHAGTIALTDASEGH